MAGRTGRTTTDHQEIQRWAEERGGRPARVRGTGGGSDPGMIRLDFPGYSGSESLEPISWDEWFGAFDDNDLALVYQERTAGGERSSFNKLVARSTAAARRRGRTHASRRGTSARSRRGTTATKRRATTRKSTTSATERARGTRRSAR